MSHSFVSTPHLRAFAACVASSTPMVFTGDPGEGKSAKVSKFGERWGYWTHTMLASLREAPDFLGNPYANPDQGWTEHLPPKFVFDVNAADKAMVILDEINSAEPSTAKALQRALEEGYVGDVQVKPGTVWVAIMNPTDIATDGYDLSGPIANRFIHLPWDFDREEWLVGILDDFESQEILPLDVMTRTPTAADKARVRGLISGFHRANHSHLRPGAPKSDLERAKPWRSPRSWTKFANAAAYLHPGDAAALSLLVEGSVGEAGATPFINYMRENDLWDPMEVLKDPSIVDWKNERGDRLYSLTSAIAALVLTMADKTSIWNAALRALTICAKNGKADVALPAMRILLSKMPTDAKVTRETQDAFADLFTRTGQWQAA